ncbi:ABC transporter ATP-binding protein [Nocardioides marmoriginsengisoli]|uniref:ABC transporter ATP-binding protein n=1 Tax=Nocardioides marmoriginsengisoli TaxID=661483 RepID=A0A3N0CHI1_9ACTN|nr:ABC transporter ATP-binding protein [Nocardioides marmoriginsengisoli]RNL62463.1 ABC transporter ATP-binding protein [Nocardioides marmoriginsengisoli]
MSESLLTVESLVAGYHGSRVIDDVSFSVGPGEGLGVVGANGAGKSTLLRTISGLVAPASGRILLEGRDITRLSPDRIARAGVLHVPEGRRVFSGLTVHENLRTGTIAGAARAGSSADPYDAVLDLFPRLRERLNQQAQTMSGGEQQMLAIARALMGRPSVLLVDEPAMGLAPVVVKRVAEHLRTIREHWGVALVVAEQSANNVDGIVGGHQLLVDGRLREVDSGGSDRANLLAAYRAAGADVPTTARSGRALTDGKNE